MKAFILVMHESYQEQKVLQNPLIIWRVGGGDNVRIFELSHFCFPQGDKSLKSYGQLLICFFFFATVSPR